MNSQTPARWYNPVRWQWRRLGRGYRRFMADASESSTYLREVGLKPVLKSLLGDCSSETVLDLGAGGAWLFDLVETGKAVACDLAPALHYPAGVKYDRGDAASLEYPSGMFDTVVCNLMLCYCADILTPLREMARVTRPGGRLIVGLVHPHFYRTGEAGADGSYVLSASLAQSRPMSILIGNRIGPFRYYYHPYPDYLNAMVEAGWTLRLVRDWYYDEADYRRHFPRGDSVARSPRVPIFTFFSCVRDA